MVEDYIVTNDNRYLKVKDIGLVTLPLFLVKEILRHIMTRELC